jgi:hypothetical protein
MAQYRIGQLRISPTQADFEQQLQNAHQAKLRPECLCTGEAGLPMYIARINNRYWIKRMPSTGRKHAVGCSSWETPEEFSGRSDLVGTALRYKEDEVALRLGFSLSHRGTGDGNAMEKSSREKPTAKSELEDTRLTLRSLLHDLWDEEGLTSWSGISTPRDWSYVYDCLTKAASRRTVKHAELLRYLYIPKALIKENQREIEGERRQRFARIAGVDDKKVHHLLVVMGEIAPIEGNGGDRIVNFKEMPNQPFVIKEDLYKQMLKHLGREMNLASTKSAGHLIMIGTVRIEREGTPVFEEVFLMYVTENWIPYENLYERLLIEDLINDGRSFMRLLRYNRPNNAPMPTLLLTDCDNAPLSIYVRESQSSPPSAQLSAAVAASKYQTIVWDVLERGELPELPPKSSDSRPWVPGDASPAQSPSEADGLARAAYSGAEPVL